MDQRWLVTIGHSMRIHNHEYRQAPPLPTNPVMIKDKTVVSVMTIGTSRGISHAHKISIFQATALDRADKRVGEASEIAQSTLLGLQPTLTPSNVVDAGKSTRASPRDTSKSTSWTNTSNQDTVSCVAAVSPPRRTTSLTEPRGLAVGAGARAHLGPNARRDRYFLLRSTVHNPSSTCAGTHGYQICRA